MIAVCHVPVQNRCQASRTASETDAGIVVWSWNLRRKRELPLVEHEVDASVSADASLTHRASARNNPSKNPMPTGPSRCPSVSFPCPPFPCQKENDKGMGKGVLQWACGFSILEILPVGRATGIRRAYF